MGPLQVEAVLAQVSDSQPGHQGEGEAAVDEHLAVWRVGGVVGVEVHLVWVVRDTSEPDVVGVCDRTPQGMANHLARGEVLKEIAGLRHAYSSLKAGIGLGPRAPVPASCRIRAAS